MLAWGSIERWQLRLGVPGFGTNPHILAAHKPKAAGSNPAPPTTSTGLIYGFRAVNQVRFFVRAFRPESDDFGRDDPAAAGSRLAVQPSRPCSSFDVALSRFVIRPV